MADDYQTGEVSVVEILDGFLKQAASLKATDLHIDPTKQGTVIRARVDGALCDLGRVERDSHESLIARIKVMSDLRTDLHAAAQDGRFSFSMDDEDFDVRVAIIPTFYGENAVLRILSGRAKEWDLKDLGFSGANSDKLLAAVSRSSGLVLATGPTGSGKTTTLYTLLKKIGGSHLVTVTLEDPVEYAIDGIRHIAVNDSAGFGFAQGLKWLVRQNPDVILVGEIRDSETARAAVQAALTGHLLLSSLHTKDSVSALVRLLDLGVESFLVASTVSVVVAGRLVRKLCESCKKPSLSSGKILQNLAGEANSDYQIFEAVGCEECQGSGYVGRIGVQEVLLVDDEIRECVLGRAQAQSFVQAARIQGMKTILEDAIMKARAGATSVSEVLRLV